MSPERDDLLDYPRPSAAADVVLLTVADGQLRPVTEVHGLPFSHDGIIARAVKMVRWEYEQKDTSRRAMEPQLAALELRAVPPGGNGLGRPARVYRKQPDTDQPLPIMI